MTAELNRSLARLFSELVNGASVPGECFILNSGDVGMLGSLAKLSAGDASRAANDGASIAAHVQHVRYGLSLMNRWAREGGNPFADARWDEAWRVTGVDAARWEEIQQGLRTETERWLEVLSAPREVSEIELTGIIGSIAHLAYHLGAVRQIARNARGPREGTF